MTEKKRNALSAALKDVPSNESANPESATNEKIQAGRSETVFLGGHFPKAFKKQLRLIAAEEETTSQALMEEAFNLLFAKKGKMKISTTKN